MGFKLFGSDSKTTKNTTNNTANFSSSFGIGGDNDGLAISGDNNVINNSVTDFGAIDTAFSFASSTNQDSKDLAEFSMMKVGESNETVANLAAEFGGNVTSLADLSISGNQALAETAMNNNASLISQFGSDMFAMSDKNAALAQASMDNSAALTAQFSNDLNSAYGQFGSDLSAVTDSAIASNAQLTSEVNNLATDMTMQTNSTLLEMANLQEQGLDNALQVAGNMSMDDNSESSVAMVKFVMIGVAVIGAAMVMK